MAPVGNQALWEKNITRPVILLLHSVTSYTDFKRLQWVIEEQAYHKYTHSMHGKWKFTMW